MTRVAEVAGFCDLHGFQRQLERSQLIFEKVYRGFLLKIGQK